MFNPEEHFMDLKGKKYLKVMWRLVWFREEKPLWCIDTEMVAQTENHAVFRAKIYDDNMCLKASGYGSESVKDFRDFIEKAETKAIGRALAMLGYGTQFAPELDEEDRIVDSPVQRKNAPEAPETPPEPVLVCDCCGTPIKAKRFANGTLWSAADVAAKTLNATHKQLCYKCYKEAKDGE